MAPSPRASITLAVPAAQTLGRAAKEPDDITLDDPISASEEVGEIELIEEIGRGGMGVVHLARQSALGRQVAVKQPNPQAPRRLARRTLLQEAWVAGALEHPNLVPVYTLVADAAGAPMVVMRRIAGRTWTELIVDPPAVVRLFGARDPLTWHLGVLMQVCSAVAYAHSRGVLHRDLKPDNVMIGAHGEVYVLDWGLAARSRADVDLPIPLATEERRVVGTPRFMAPEQAIGDGRAIGERTDVYLLGGLLYALLTGEGPHPGDSVDETLAAIPHFVPRLPPSLPPRLTALVTQALAADPDQRPPDAESLRRAIAAFLEERGADELFAQAEAMRHSLAMLLAADAPDRNALSRAFGAARFGYQQALHAFPGHAGARNGLRQASLAMARHALATGDGHGAEALLAELVDPPAELSAAREALRAQEAETTRIRADRDPTVGQRTRIFVFSLVMVLWTVIPFTTWLQEVPFSWPATLVAHGSMFLFAIGLVIWARESLSRTALNRRVAAILILVQGALLLADLAWYLAGQGPQDALRASTLLFTLISAMAVELIGWAALPPTLCYAATLVISARRPDLHLLFTAISNAVAAITAFLRWFPDARGRLLVRTPAEKAARARGKRPT
jgi:serine/threonine-protein kinase